MTRIRPHDARTVMRKSWTLCNEDYYRITPLSGVDSKTAISEGVGSKDDCVNSGLSKVALTTDNCRNAQMVNEESNVEAKTGHKIQERPPDPQRLDCAGKLIATDTSDKELPLKSEDDLIMLDFTLSGSPVLESAQSESIRTPALPTGHQPEAFSASLQSVDAEHSTNLKTALNPGIQLAGQPLLGIHPVVSSGFSNLTPFMSRICFSTSQVPAVQKLPLPFQSGTILTPNQPLVYIPPSTCGQSLSVASLPSTLGVASSVTLPVLPSYLPERCLTGIMAPTELHPYSFASSEGRPLASDPKVASLDITKIITSAPSASPSIANNVTPVKDSPPSYTDSASSTALPNKQCPSSHSSLPANCGSPIPLLSISSLNRTPGHIDQNTDGASGSFSPLKSPPQLEREMVSPQDCNEMPLDLSSKSNRQKHTPPNQRKTPPMPVLTPVHTSGKAALSTVMSKSDCSSRRHLQSSYTSSTGTSNIGAPAPFVIFPEYLTNGDSRSSQVLGSSASWIKRSASLLGTIPGTYVGVANPVPASLLIGKDSTVEMNSDLRHLAKQESISIIDQGEQKNPGACAKKAIRTSIEGQQVNRSFLFGQIPSMTSVCTAKETTLWNTPVQATVQTKCPGNGNSSTSHVLPVGWPTHQVSVSTGISTTGQPLQNPCAASKMPSSVGECILLPNTKPSDTTVLPIRTSSERNLECHSRTVGPTSLKDDPTAKGVMCKPVYTEPISEDLLVPKLRADDHPKFVPSSLPKVGVTTECNIRSKSTSSVMNNATNDQNSNIGRPEESKTNIGQIDGFKMNCGRKSGDSKPKNKVLATYLSHDQPTNNPHNFRNIQDTPLLNKDRDLKGLNVPEDEMSRHSRRKSVNVEPVHCVHEVDLTKVKIEKTDGDEAYGSPTSQSRAEWMPVNNLGGITKAKVKNKIKKENKELGIKRKSKRQMEDVSGKRAQKKSKCKMKEEDEVSSKTYKRKKRKRRFSLKGASGKNSQSITPPVKESDDIKTRRRRRRPIKIEPLDQEEGYLEKKPKNNFRDFIPVVLTSRTRSQSGSANSSFASIATECDTTMDEVLPPMEDVLHSKRRRGRKVYGVNRYHQRKIKEEPHQEEISCPSHNLRRTREVPQKVEPVGSFWTLFESDEEIDGHIKKRKRRRQKNRKYQNGEYLTEREEELEMAHCYKRRKAVSDTKLKKRRRSPVLGTSNLWLRSRLPPFPQELQRHFFKEEPEDCAILPGLDKPCGKRKFKTKHLGDNTDEDVKVKRRRWVSSPKSVAVKSPSPKKRPDVGTPSKRGRISAFGSPDSSNTHLVPPEARRLIVNKNAGETLLQRAARLGYMEVVLYCLQRDLGDVNRRDNAGYTALHEACSRGWIDIMQTLLDNGANVNCSAQDGTRPIHDATVNDSLEAVWLLLSYGADPTLATYSGQTAMKLASSDAMKQYLNDYLDDLKGRSDGDPHVFWDFYSSAVLEQSDKMGDNILLRPPENSDQDEELEESDCFLFEFSDTPLLPCYNLQVSVSCGSSNWFLLSDVLKRLKLSSRIFQARFPHFEVASLQKKEFHRQVSTSQLLAESAEQWTQDDGETLELVRYEPELMKLLGSSVEFQAASS
ncbi:BCL-6 corepressor-like protein 1 isoform X1 [Pleurodeles waltl]|uniref:BCL-6 corepressor-like protein 1 isoform X1 n=1 Tax=Pleurodeles waltl TaxID=8319 RepID=UPI003709AB3C